MKLLAIIPARGGSKRIPRKNIKPFLGKPIILYSIEAAVQSGLFDEVMVSTDDTEITRTALMNGATVPFMRSELTSNDFAHLADVIQEVLLKYRETGKSFDVFCCILPTAPFIKPERLKQAYDLLINKNYDSVYTLIRFSYPVQRALKIEDGRISMIQPENFNKHSQDLSPTYHDSGQFYWMKTNRFLEQKSFLTTNTGALILSDIESQDIDNEEDWQIAEIKYRIIQEGNK
jgi:N-acylneuraminate cytidylyltransferase